MTATISKSKSLEIAEAKTYPVVETFCSLQGEGMYIGQPSFFIRLAKCNMSPLCTWCIARGQLVTMADGSRIPIEEIQIGDLVLGVHDPENQEHIRFAEAKVLATTSRGVKPLWSLNGLRATGDHRVLCQTQRTRYERVQDLSAMSSSIVSIPEPKFWDSASWLSGYLDGDGSFYKQLTRSGRYQRKFKVTSIDLELIDIAEETMKTLGFSPRRVRHNPGRGSFGSTMNLYCLEITRTDEAERLEELVHEHRGGPSYLGGFFDAEGSFDGTTIRLAQKDGFLRDYVLNLLQNGGITYRVYENTIALVLGGQRGALEFFATHRPRLSRKWRSILGHAVRCEEVVESVFETSEEAEVFDLTTTTGNFFAGGICVHNCDTKYADTQEPQALSGATLVQLAEAAGVSHVVITGGEPLIHPAISSLCDLLYRAQLAVTVETNATIYNENLRWCVALISLSPKLGSSGHHPVMDVVSKYCEATNAGVYYETQLKFVVSNYHDLRELQICLETLSSDHNVDFRKVRVILQPNGLEGNAEQLLMRLETLRGWVMAQDDLRSLPNIQILPQLHRLLWGKRVGI
jgi:7-carboxy-7-deazaguanine synthase